jgi:putative FmdB family regulatory protein
MPTYEYRCAKCGEDLEVYQTFSDEPLKKHAGCGGKLTKVLSSVGIVLKGSGFYKTDNRDSGTKRKAREDASGSSGDSSSNGGGSDTSEKSDKAGKSETKASDSGSSDSSGSKSKSTSTDKKSGEKKSGEKKSPAKSA